MAKLTSIQRNNIVAKWNTGQYTKTALAKTYKVTEKVIRALVGKEEPTNSHIVEAQLLIEGVKKSEKSPIEIQAINQAVQHRLKEQYSDDNKRIKIYDLTDKVLELLDNKMEKGTKQIVMKVKEYSKDGGSIESLSVIDVELDTTDFKNIQDTIDKASVTNNTNDRHAKSGDVNVSATAAVQNNNITVEFVD
jgi:hypothetical protein